MKLECTYLDFLWYGTYWIIHAIHQAVPNRRGRSLLMQTPNFSSTICYLIYNYALHAYEVFFGR